MGLLYVIGSYPNYFLKKRSFEMFYSKAHQKTKNKKQVVSPSARCDLSIYLY